MQNCQLKNLAAQKNLLLEGLGERDAKGEEGTTSRKCEQGQAMLVVFRDGSPGKISNF